MDWGIISDGFVGTWYQAPVRLIHEPTFAEYYVIPMAVSFVLLEHSYGCCPQGQELLKIGQVDDTVLINIQDRISGRWIGRVRRFLAADRCKHSALQVCPIVDKVLVVIHNRLAVHIVQRYR